MNYKRLWIRLKSNISDDTILQLMEKYEKEAELKDSKAKSRNKKSTKSKVIRPIYSIRLHKQEWYDLYTRVNQIRYSKIRKKLLPEEENAVFKEEFKRVTDLLKQGTITHKNVEEWLQFKYDGYSQLKEVKSHLNKNKITPHGFIKKSRDELTETEIINIVIDDMVSRFYPHISGGLPAYTQDKFNYLFKKYEDDWRQELWAWCYENYTKNYHLKEIIKSYSNHDYLYKAKNRKYIAHLFSRMNMYIIPYILKLNYSITSGPKYGHNINYLYESKYSSNLIHTADYIEKLNYYDNCFDNLYNLALKEMIENLIDGVFVPERYTRQDKFIAERYKMVIEMRFGFNSSNYCYTYKEIGQELNRTRSRSQQIEELALAKIRKYMYHEHKRGRLDIQDFMDYIK